MEQEHIFRMDITGAESREGIPAPTSQTLVQSAQAAGIELLTSCRNGTCRTCICMLTSGEVNYRIEWPGLSLDEKREGWMLPCVAYPSGDVVIELPF